MMRLSNKFHAASWLMYLITTMLEETPHRVTYVWWVGMDDDDVGPVESNKWLDKFNSGWRDGK